MSRECCGDDEPNRPASTEDGNYGTETGDHPTRTTPASTEPEPWWKDRDLALPVLSGVMLITGLALGFAGHQVPALISHSIGLAAGAWTFVPGALRRLIRGTGRNRLGVGLLMTIAATGAVLLGHVSEAAALAFLFSIAETLEDKAMDRAKRGLHALLSLIPDTARISRPDGEHTIPASDLQENDTFIVGAGERIATDGIVLTGQSWVDTSAITGESIPVDVTPATPVLAGSVNGTGTLHIRATADGRDNSLTTIVGLVEQAHAAKGQRARLADRVASPLVPAVLVIAALVALVGVFSADPGTWLERALVVLVAASPCALAIAVPVTVISAIGSASTFGVIVKSGAAFEQLGTIRQVAFDKTGTLTRNQPRVVSTHTAPGHTRDEVLRLAAALESTSTHPLAEAILIAAPDHPVATDIQERPGYGITGAVGAHEIRVGSPRWIEPQTLHEQADTLANDGMSLIVVEVDTVVIGVIGIRDEIRPEAAQAIATLHHDGIGTVMLTGDNTRTAHAIARQAGIDTVEADQLPDGKAAHLRRLCQVTPTAMIGDGINDAPALASATVGIALGATGSDAAVESADVAFTGTDLRLIPGALAHARRGRAIMTQNIGLALAIIVVLFPLALFGVLGLASVVLVHEVAEIFVIANGLRAARVTRPPAVVPVSTQESSSAAV